MVKCGEGGRFCCFFVVKIVTCFGLRFRVFFFIWGGRVLLLECGDLSSFKGLIETSPLKKFA